MSILIHCSILNVQISLMIHHVVNPRMFAVSVENTMTRAVVTGQMYASLHHYAPLIITCASELFVLL